MLQLNAEEKKRLKSELCIIDNLTKLSKFIDLKKLVTSHEFATCLDAAIRAYHVRNDILPIKKLANLFESSSFYRAILDYLCDHACLAYTWNKGELKLTRKSVEQLKITHFEHYLNRLSGKKSQVFPEYSEKNKDGYLDMLDAPFRVSGSFEGGKRK